MSMAVVLGAIGLDDATIRETSGQYLRWAEEQTGRFANLGEEERRNVLEAWAVVADRLARGAVGIGAAIWLGVATAVYAVLRTFAPAPGKSGPSLARFAPWDGLVWVLICALGLVIVDLGKPGTIGWNLLFFTSGVYWVRGLGVMDHSLARRGAALGLRAVASGALVLASLYILFLPVAAVGLFDTWFDFRRPAPPR
ncbi:MAG: hypothetical protein CME06_14620 [Gemmatimonadetes bacterium]|nr:hypothetical protein [Gemmatimonadota bacterium]